MLDEFGTEIAAPSLDLPAGPPELCSAEFQPSRDLRIALHRGGALVCYFRSPVESLGVCDVTVEIGASTLPVQTVASPEPGVWQANLLLTSALPAQAEVRLRLGEGAWSNPLRIA
jgi:hypothetical protein